MTPAFLQGLQGGLQDELQGGLQGLPPPQRPKTVVRFPLCSARTQPLPLSAISSSSRESSHSTADGSRSRPPSLPGSPQRPTTVVVPPPPACALSSPRRSISFRALCAGCGT